MKSLLIIVCLVSASCSTSKSFMRGDSKEEQDVIEFLDEVIKATENNEIDWRVTADLEYVGFYKRNALVLRYHHDGFVYVVKELQTYGDGKFFIKSVYPSGVSAHYWAEQSFLGAYLRMYKVDLEKIVKNHIERDSVDDFFSQVKE